MGDNPIANGKLISYSKGKQNSHTMKGEITVVKIKKVL